MTKNELETIRRDWPAQDPGDRYRVRALLDAAAGSDFAAEFERVELAVDMHPDLKRKSEAWFTGRREGFGVFIRVQVRTRKGGTVKHDIHGFGENVRDATDELIASLDSWFAALA